MEAAQITRTVARALGLNEELAEAVALAHDLGHTPFGHAGEQVLNDLMAPARRLRSQRAEPAHHRLDRSALPEFSRPQPDLRGARGHHQAFAFQDRPAAQEFDPSLFPCLEAQIVDLADEIAYLAHDVDDGLKAADAHA